MMYTRRNWVALVSILGLRGKRASALADVSDSGTDGVAADDTKPDKKPTKGSDTKKTKSDKLKLNQQSVRQQNQASKAGVKPYTSSGDAGCRRKLPNDKAYSKVNCPEITKAKRRPALTKAKKT